MLHKPKTFFAIHRFESKCYEDSAGKLEVREPMVQSGLLGETHTYHFGWDESDSRRLIQNAVSNCAQKVGKNSVVIYGAGAHTTQYWDLLSTLNIVAIADKNSALWGTTLKQLPVISPQEIAKFADQILISSRAYEANILGELSDMHPMVKCHCLYGDDFMAQRLEQWASELEKQILEFQPELLVHTPTHVKENLSAEFFLQLKAKLPALKIITLWWDYDEENADSGYLEYERQVLRYADLVIENSNATRLERMHKQLPPYDQHPHPERVIFHPTWFDPSLFYHDPALEKDIEIAIFGSRVGERGKWIDLLKAHFGDRFQHIGGVSGESRNPIPTEEYAALLRRTKIVVNTQTYAFREQCKGKVREAMQCGAILLEQVNSETKQFLAQYPASAVYFFNDEQSLLNLSNEYLAHSCPVISNVNNAHIDWTVKLLSLLD